MSTRQARLLIGAAAVLALTVAVSTPARSLEEFRYKDTTTFTVGTSPDVTIDAISGDVSYTAVGGTSATVEVVIQVRAKDEQEADLIRRHVQLALEGGDGYLHVGLKRPNEFYRWLRDIGSSRSADISFHVRGPRGADGELTTVSGNMDIEGVSGHMAVRSVSGDAAALGMSGRLDIRSTSGNVRVEDCSAPVRAETVSGDMAIDSCSAELIAHSVSGEIRARRITGEIETETVSGEIDVRQARGTMSAETISGDINIDQESGGLDVNTTSGEITIRSSAKGEKLAAKSVSGDVKLQVDPGGIGEISLETHSGDIETNLPLKVSSHSDHHLSGLIGNGDGTITVTTMSGGIVLGRL